MARKIIVLEKLNDGGATFNVAYWLDVPSGRQATLALVQAAATSAVLDITGAELTAIRAGQIVEVLETVNQAAGTAIATVGAAAVARRAVLQAALNADTTYSRYGTFHDGTTWTVKNIP